MLFTTAAMHSSTVFVLPLLPATDSIKSSLHKISFGATVSRVGSAGVAGHARLELERSSHLASAASRVENDSAFPGAGLHQHSAPTPDLVSAKTSAKHWVVPETGCGRDHCAVAALVPAPVLAPLLPGTVSSRTNIIMSK